MGDGFELRSAESRDCEDLTGLFNTVFCSPALGSPALGSPARRPRSVEHWHWKYVDNGVGSHSTIAVSKNGGGVIGHVGGLPFPTWCRGEVRSTNQSVDNMTHPRERAGLRRVGVFARMVNHWVATYFGADRDFLAWGFPSAENFRIGQKFSKYSLVRTINVLVHEHPGSIPCDTPGIELARVARFGADADDLWRRCSADVEIGVVRSARYLNWRYAEHPEVRYTLHEARDAAGGALRGVAVTRSAGFDDDVLMVMDWLVPEDDDEAARALLGAAAREARAAERRAVAAWFPEGLTWFRRLQLAGFLVRPTQQILVARSWNRGVTIADLRRGLYATAGDMDSC